MPSFHVVLISALGLIPLINAAWPSQNYNSFPYAAPVLSWEKNGAATVPGYLFFASILEDAGNGGFNAPTIMTDEGDLIWRAPSDNLNGSRNVDVQNVAGTDYLTYWTGNHNNAYGSGYGGVTFLDNTYQQAYNVCMVDLPIIPIGGTFLNQPCTLDSHESRVTAKGTLLVTVRNVTRADLTSRGGQKNGYLLDSLFYEVDIPTQKVLFRWSAYEHNNDIGMFALSATKPAGETSLHKPWDFFHMNSVYDVPEPLGGYLVSSRYLSSAIKVDSKGNIEWYLDGQNGGGSFKLPQDGNFRFQHTTIAANVTKSSLQVTLFDNNNKDGAGKGRESSGLELSLDLKKYTASVFRRVVPNNMTVSDHTGSYQSLAENHIFIDYGSPPIFNEFDENDNLIYTASASSKGGDVYRCYRKTYSAYPGYPPSVFATQPNSLETTVYVSWNGATEVSYYKFKTGSKCSNRTKLPGTHNKTGFETAITLSGIFGTHVQAVAYAANGTMLGQSYLVKTNGENSSAGVDGSNVIDCS